MSIPLLAPRGRPPRLQADRFPHTEQDIILHQTDADIQLLETRRNQLCFTSRVPDDIFLLIFALIQREGPSGEKPYTWITLGAVCQRWRRLLVSAPNLWSHIDPSAVSSSFVDLLLERSQGCLLDFVIRSEGMQVAAERMRQSLHRTRTLSISGYGYYLDVPAPFLEELTVSKSRQFHYFSGTDIQPQLFFGGVAPKLRRLCFVAHPTLMGSWAGLLTHVQYLNLNVKSWNGFVPAVSSMISVKELVLSFPSPPAGRGTRQEAAPRHHIRALLVLHLHSVTSACSAFLSHFTIPSSAQLRFEMVPEHIPDSEQLGRSIFECRRGIENRVQAMTIQPMPVSRIQGWKGFLWNGLLGERRESDSPFVLVSLGPEILHLRIWLFGWLRCADLWTLKEVEVKDRELLESVFPLEAALEPLQHATIISS